MKNLSIISVLALCTACTLAAPVPIPDATDVIELDARQPFIGFLFRAAGKALKSVPEKAGKKMAKKMGNGQNNVVEGKRLKETTERWNKYLGKEQDPKCVQGWMNTFSRNGGFNAVINCDKHKTGLFAGHKGGFYPSVSHRSGKKKREFLEDGLEEREFGDDDLEARDFVPVHLDLLTREFLSDFDPEERDLLYLDMGERDFLTDFELDDIE